MVPRRHIYEISVCGLTPERLKPLFGPLRQKVGNRGETLRACVLQRGGPVTVGDRRVGPGGEQDPHNLLVWRVPIAQDHRLQKRGPAEVLT